MAQRNKAVTNDDLIGADKATVIDLATMLIKPLNKINKGRRFRPLSNDLTHQSSIFCLHRYGSIIRYWNKLGFFSGWMDT